jgi:hypothetical protein
MKLLKCLIFLIFTSSAALAGEIFGTIVDAGKPVAAGVKVEVSVAGKSVTGETDQSGTYHVFIAEKGKGTLTVQYKDQKPADSIFSFDKAARYDYIIETDGGKMILKRK